MVREASDLSTYDIFDSENDRRLSRVRYHYLLSEMILFNDPVKRKGMNMATMQKAKSSAAPKQAKKDGVDRVKEFRERHNLKTFSVDLPVPLIKKVDEHLAKKGISRRVAFTHLINTQMLRKR